jgi:hypothetical protein
VIDSDQDEEEPIYNEGGCEEEDEYEIGGLGDDIEGTLKRTKIIMKNGCCRDCMKAFSKTGRVSHSLS